MNLVALLSMLLISALATATALKTPCRNVKPRGPFYLQAQYKLPNGTLVASLVNPKKNRYGKERFVLAVERPGYNKSNILDMGLERGRLRFASTFPPHAPFGPLIEFTNSRLVRGDDMRFTAPTKEDKGSFGLVDTDIPGHGDAGCAITINGPIRTRGFMLCHRNGRAVVTWKRFVKVERCVEMNLVAVSFPPY